MTADDGMERYARQIVIPSVGVEGQERLAAARVLVVGIGGLGSPVAYYLAAAGVGCLGLADGDAVSVSNLQRQIIHGMSTLGVNKARSAAARIADLNPSVRTIPYAERLSSARMESLVREYDVVAGCLDTISARYELNDACVRSGKPLVEGGVMRWSGIVMTIIPGKSPCYRCVFPQVAGGGLDPAEAGVMGPVPGAAGSIQAMEVLKLILGIGESLAGRLLLMDLLDGSFREVSVPRNPSCPACACL